MGREYQTRIKEQYGRPAIVGYETLAVGAALAPAASGPSNLTDANGVATYTLERDGKLDVLNLQLGSAAAAASGDVSVRVMLNGVAQGSGTISAGNTSAELTFQTEKDNELALSSGDALLLDVTKGATGIVRNLTARAAIRLFEV